MDPDAGTPGAGGAAQEFSGNGFGHNGVPDFMAVSNATFFCCKAQLYCVLFADELKLETRQTLDRLVLKGTLKEKVPFSLPVGPSDWQDGR